MTNPYGAPAADMTDVIHAGETYAPRVWSLQGRIGRCRYLAYVLGTNLAIMLAMMVVFGVLTAVSPSLAPIGFIFYVPLLVFALGMAKRRLNDMGHTGWLAALTLIPFVNFLFMLWLIIGPGTEGTNQYGPAPSANTKWAVAGALAFPAIMVLGVLAAVAIPAYQQYVAKAKAAQEAQPLIVPHK